MAAFYFGLEGEREVARGIRVEPFRLDDGSWTAHNGNIVGGQDYHLHRPDFDCSGFGGFREALKEALSTAEDMDEEVFGYDPERHYAPAGYEWDELR